jgi:hypothetical protein
MRTSRPSTRGCCHDLGRCRCRRRARLLIVGDDLSGTADCAVTCAHFGLDSVVALGADADAALAEDVLALDADTRGLAAGDAARLNTAAWQRTATVVGCTRKSIPPCAAMSPPRSPR